MKKTIFISIILSLIATAAVAQDAKLVNDPGPPTLILPDDPPGPTNYYPNATGTITKSGYSYKYRNSHFAGGKTPKILDLYNASNSYLDVEWGHKDGTPLSVEESLVYAPNSEFFESNLTVEQTLTMVNRCFTHLQKNTLKEKSVFIEVRVDPSTGRIADVYFTFNRNSPFANIPVETYRSIELALKQNLTFTVTAEGRKMNYLQLFWSQEF